MDHNHPDFGKVASDFLLDLAHGKYDHQIEKIQAVLSVLGPDGKTAATALQVLLWVNRSTAPLQVVKDEHGTWVPSTNSHYDRDTGRFID